MKHFFKGRAERKDEFTITMIFPGAFLVVAENGDTVGIFGSKQNIDEACEKYRKSKEK